MPRLCVSIICMSLMVAVLVEPVSCQEDPEDEEVLYERKRQGAGRLLDPNRMYLGGNLGFWFGQQFLFLEVSPLLGYRITDRWHAGPGLSYFYFRDYGAAQGPHGTSVYGGRFFSRYFVLENLFVHGEYELLNLEVLVYDGTGYVPERIFIKSLFVGAGYMQRFGRNSGWMIALMWPVTQSHPHFYPFPTRPFIIRTGFMFSL